MVCKHLHSQVPILWNDKHLEGPTFQRFEIRSDLNDGDVYASKGGRSPPSRLGRLCMGLISCHATSTRSLCKRTPQAERSAAYSSVCKHSCSIETGGDWIRNNAESELLRSAGRGSL